MPPLAWAVHPMLQGEYSSTTVGDTLPVAILGFQGTGSLHTLLLAYACHTSVHVTPLQNHPSVCSREQRVPIVELELRAPKTRTHFTPVADLDNHTGWPQ
jgi:hypothetical protein